MHLHQAAIHHQLKDSMQLVNHHTHLSKLAFKGKNFYFRSILSLYRFIDHETMSMQSTVSLGRVGRVGNAESLGEDVAPLPTLPSPLALHLRRQLGPSFCAT